MDEKLVFSILGIEPTKDEDRLKERYHELLRDTNPEDDPEGFKRLREAYETAIALAKRPAEESEEARDKDEIDLWLDKVNDVYWYLSTRNDPELWKGLFRDDVCVALDTALEARERFLVFLMSHVYVDQPIWQLIDAEFRIREDIEELKEMFPADFLNYIVYQIENPSFLAYDKFEVLALDEAEVEVDNYIVSYLRIKSDIDRREQLDTIMQRLDDLHAYEVYHPYEDVERLRIVLLNEDGKEAEYLPKVEKLLDQASEDTYIGYWCGRIYAKLNEWDQAYTCWNTVLEAKPDQYNARVGMAEYYIEKAEYVRGKELIMDLLEENGRDSYTLDLMRKVNPYLIDYYMEEAQKEDYKKNMIEACWCMFQNEMFKETLKLLKTLDIQEEDKEYYDYVNMTGRCYLGMEKYQEAITYLLKWEEARQALQDDGTEKYQKRISREGFIKSAIGVACQSLKKYDMAELYLKEGIEKEKDDAVRYSVMERLALLYYDQKKYAECKEVCDKIIEEDPEYYPAYIRRQQAAYDNHDAQAVIDDYYNAIHLFAGYYRPYLLAVEVFCIYHQYEDAKKVLDAAKEHNVQHEMLMFYEIKVRRNLAESDEEYEEILQLCDHLKLMIRERKQAEGKGSDDSVEKTDAELLDEDLKKDGMSDEKVDSNDLIFEQVLVLMDMERYEEALDRIKLVMNRGNREIRFRWVRADIYRIRRMFREAFEEYQELLQEIPDEVDIVYYCGICLQRLNRDEEALRYYQKVQSLDPQHTRVHHALMEIYSSRFDRYELKTAYGQAIQEATLQLKLVKNAYYYIERGLLYMDNFNFQKALDDYHHALELEPENIYALNNIGYVYQAQGKFEEALKYYKKSIGLMKDEWSILPFINSSKCYQAMRQWDSGVAVLQDALRHYKPSTSIYNRLIELYTSKQDIEKVKETCERAVKLNLLTQSDYYNELSQAYVSMGNFPEGLHIFKQWYVWLNKRKEKNRDYLMEKAKLLEAQGIFYFYHRELRKAIKYLEEAWKIDKQNDFERTRVGIHLSNAYYFRRQMDKAGALAKETMGYMLNSRHIPQKLKSDEQESPESLHYYLSYRPLAPLRTFEIAELYISLGDMDRAWRMLEECLKAPRCRHCSFGVCYDAWLIMANIEEIRGNIPHAIELYKKAMEINPCDIEPMLTLDALRSKKKGEQI